MGYIVDSHFLPVRDLILTARASTIRPAMKTSLWFCCLVLVAGPAVAAELHDLEFAHVAGESLRLDAWLPEGAGPHAAAILVHGGGWTGGDKSGGPRKALIAPMQDPLQQAGVAWFSINYRLAPKHPYPACLDDVLAAIRWVKAHAGEYRLDPDRLALVGESAGGHLVSLAAIKASAAERVAAVVPFYGPSDLTLGLKPDEPLRKNFVALFGRPTYDEPTQALLRAASPLSYVRAGLPPFLLVHGTADVTVPYEQSTLLQAKLRAVGVPCDFISIEGGGHGMGPWIKLVPDYQQQVAGWIVRTLHVLPPAARP